MLAGLLHEKWNRIPRVLMVGFPKAGKSTLGNSMHTELSPVVSNARDTHSSMHC